MVPASIRNNLASLRRRERLLTFLWGAACWLSIVLVLLLVCGFIDWLIDRDRDTPLGVRLCMFAIQGVIGGLAALLFILLPQLRRLPDWLLALWVEDKVPQFDHRLIGAVQLNEPDVELDGMSPELVAVMTDEAEKQTRRVGSFAQVADHTRLALAAVVFAPTFLLFTLPFVIWPGLAFALLGRQMLLPLDIPHSVDLESVSPEYWPIGDPIPIRYRVTGLYTEDMVGSVVVTPDGQAGDRFPLKFIQADENGAIFGVDVPKSSANITYRARLADGRARASTVMNLVPRPEVTQDKAWVRLPAYCGLRPARKGINEDDRRYEEPQVRGDVVSIPGSGVRVQFEVAGPDHQAWIALLGPKHLDPKESYEDAAAREIEKRRIPMRLKKSKRVVTEELIDGTKAEREIDVYVAEAVFDLDIGLTGYRMIVKDQHGFDNIPPKRRKLWLIPEPAPLVTLLRDTFSDSSATADFDVEGLPVIIGGKIRIPYECSHKYGLGKAQILYRILKEHVSGNDPVEEDDWIKSPLPEVPADPRAGPFNTKTGVFLNTEFDQQVEFHAIPSASPDVYLGRTQGGGRYFLDTKGLLDRKTGKRLQLKSGDKIEYCIKVYAAHRVPEESTPFTISEPRVSVVMELGEFEDWRRRVSKEDERVKFLEIKQKGVFGPK